jgi:hypothetical protein
MVLQLQRITQRKVVDFFKPSMDHADIREPFRVEINDEILDHVLNHIALVLIVLGQIKCGRVKPSCAQQRDMELPSHVEKGVRNLVHDIDVCIRFRVDKVGYRDCPRLVLRSWSNI